MRSGDWITVVAWFVLAFAASLILAAILGGGR